MAFSIIRLAIQVEQDVVTARQRTREIAAALGFDAQQQTRLATAMSEVARNAFRYAGGGEASFLLEGETRPQLLQISVVDSGPGFGNLEEILAGRYKSKTGLGLGLLGVQRLVDRLSVDTAPGRGTTVVLGKLLPPAAPLFTPTTFPELKRAPSMDLLEEFRGQNRELLFTLNELRRRQEDLIRLNRELEDTNRGVVALYAELDEKADSLRRADDVKSRFLSNMSHEFRTPLNSVLALSRILLDNTDGPLNAEQTKQVGFIRKSAESLSELVNDLLDLARVEAGKSVIRQVEFEAVNLFAALRGMLRPLLVGSAVALIFDDPEPTLPVLDTDEGKLSQILRNFISNALKFTEHGEIRVGLSYDTALDRMSFTVSDTGIGIAPEDQAAIFEEFAQVENHIQKNVKGTGLGLPLSKKLAELLGGAVSVKSEPGSGSTFTVWVPRVIGAQPSPPAQLPVSGSTSERQVILAVEDDVETQEIFKSHLRELPFQVVGARSLREARNFLSIMQPVAILLDLLLQGEESWAFLAELKSSESTQFVPVIVVSTVSDPAKVLALGADAYARKPVGKEELIRLVLERIPIDYPKNSQDVS